MISKQDLFFVMGVIFIGWLLDVLSTIIGFSVRNYVPGGFFYLYESSPFFLLCPAAWLGGLWLLAYLAYLLHPPGWLETMYLLGLMGSSFIPGIRNILLILEVV